MAGYGNQTAPDYTETDEHKTTRLGLHESTEPYSGGHTERKSGTVGGAGFGNKSAPDYTGKEHETTRFGSHENTDPYSGGHETHKSGTVGGAGFGKFQKFKKWVIETGRMIR
jgi:hypothetical protein